MWATLFCVLQASGSVHMESCCCWGPAGFRGAQGLGCRVRQHHLCFSHPHALHNVTPRASVIPKNVCTSRLCARCALTLLKGSVERKKSHHQIRLLKDSGSWRGQTFPVMGFASSTPPSPLCASPQRPQVPLVAIEAVQGWVPNVPSTGPGQALHPENENHLEPLFS